MKKNLEIRTLAREKGVYLYEIADALGISEQTFNRYAKSLSEAER